MLVPGLAALHQEDRLVETGLLVLAQEPPDLLRGAHRAARRVAQRNTGLAEGGTAHAVAVAVVLERLPLTAGSGRGGGTETGVETESEVEELDAVGAAFHGGRLVLVAEHRDGRCDLRSTVTHSADSMPS
ncbi:hypothetical protein SFUMM280S_07327 [Streptomyces fumanus]